jgi:hypothetical protein
MEKSQFELKISTGQKKNKKTTKKKQSNNQSVKQCNHLQRGACKLCLFVYLEPPEQFCTYPAAFTITGDRAANLDLCLALMTFGSEGSFSCRTFVFCATPTAIWDLGLYNLIRRIGTHVPQWDSKRGRKDHQIFAPPL